jgi:hypothetical protein
MWMLILVSLPLVFGGVLQTSQLPYIYTYPRKFLVLFSTITTIFFDGTIYSRNSITCYPLHFYLSSAEEHILLLWHSRSLSLKVLWFTLTQNDVLSQKMMLQLFRSNDSEVLLWTLKPKMTLPPIFKCWQLLALLMALLTMENPRSWRVTTEVLLAADTLSKVPSPDDSSAEISPLATQINTALLGGKSSHCTGSFSYGDELCLNKVFYFTTAIPADMPAWFLSFNVQWNWGDVAHQAQVSKSKSKSLPGQN